MIYKEEYQQRKAERLSFIYEEYSVPEYIKDFLENNIVSENAKIQYWTTIKLFLEWCIRNNYIESNGLKDINLRELSGLKTIVFTRYFDSLKRRGRQMSTINTKIKQLKSFFKFLSFNDYIEKDYIQGISSRKYKLKNDNAIKEKKLPSKEMIIQLEKNVSNIPNVFLKERNFTIVEILLNAGLRENELVGLNVADLFLDETNPYLKVIGKGAYSKDEYRKIYLKDDTVKLLRQWLKIRNNILTNKKQLFITSKGKRLTDSSIYKICTQYSDGSITPHMLRHYYGTKLYKETNDIVFVKEQMGHSSINVTSNTYVNGFTKL